MSIEFLLQLRNQMGNIGTICEEIVIFNCQNIWMAARKLFLLLP
jgi:hypothetical protein